jgi:hypothetical protein
MDRKEQQRELNKFTHFSVYTIGHTKVCKKQMFSNGFICLLSPMKSKWNLRYAKCFEIGTLKCLEIIFSGI